MPLSIPRSPAGAASGRSRLPTSVGINSSSSTKNKNKTKKQSKSKGSITAASFDSNSNLASKLPLPSSPCSTLPRSPCISTSSPLLMTTPRPDSNLVPLPTPNAIPIQMPIPFARSTHPSSGLSKVPASSLTASGITSKSDNHPLQTPSTLRTRPQPQPQPQSQSRSQSQSQSRPVPDFQTPTQTQAQPTVQTRHNATSLLSLATSRSSPALGSNASMRGTKTIPTVIGVSKAVDPQVAGNSPRAGIAGMGASGIPLPVSMRKYQLQDPGVTLSQDGVIKSAHSRSRSSEPVSEFASISASKTVAATATAAVAIPDVASRPGANTTGRAGSMVARSGPVKSEIDVSGTRGTLANSSTVSTPKSGSSSGVAARGGKREGMKSTLIPVNTKASPSPLAVHHISRIQRPSGTQPSTTTSSSSSPSLSTPTSRSVPNHVSGLPKRPTTHAGATLSPIIPRSITATKQSHSPGPHMSTAPPSSFSSSRPEHADTKINLEADSYTGGGPALTPNAPTSKTIPSKTQTTSRLRPPNKSQISPRNLASFPIGGANSSLKPATPATSKNDSRLRTSMNTSIDPKDGINVRRINGVSDYVCGRRSIARASGETKGLEPEPGAITGISESREHLPVSLSAGRTYATCVKPGGLPDQGGLATCSSSESKPAAGLKSESQSHSRSSASALASASASASTSVSGSSKPISIMGGGGGSRLLRSSIATEPTSTCSSANAAEPKAPGLSRPTSKHVPDDSAKSPSRQMSIASSVSDTSTTASYTSASSMARHKAFKELQAALEEGHVDGGGAEAEAGARRLVKGPSDMYRPEQDLDLTQTPRAGIDYRAVFGVSTDEKASNGKMCRGREGGWERNRNSEPESDSRHEREREREHENEHEPEQGQELVWEPDPEGGIPDPAERIWREIERKLRGGRVSSGPGSDLGVASGSGFGSGEGIASGNQRGRWKLRESATPRPPSSHRVQVQGGCGEEGEGGGEEDGECDGPRRRGDRGVHQDGYPGSDVNVYADSIDKVANEDTQMNRQDSEFTVSAYLDPEVYICTPQTSVAGSIAGGSITGSGDEQQYMGRDTRHSHHLHHRHHHQHQHHRGASGVADKMAWIDPWQAHVQAETPKPLHGTNVHISNHTATSSDGVSKARKHADARVQAGSLATSKSMAGPTTTATATAIFDMTAPLIPSISTTNATPANTPCIRHDTLVRNQKRVRRRVLEGGDDGFAGGVVNELLSSGYGARSEYQPGLRNGKVYEEEREEEYLAVPVSHGSRLQDRAISPCLFSEVVESGERVTSDDDDDNDPRACSGSDQSRSPMFRLDSQVVSALEALSDQGGYGVEGSGVLDMALCASSSSSGGSGRASASGCGEIRMLLETDDMDEVESEESRGRTSHRSRVGLGQGRERVRARAKGRSGSEQRREGDRLEMLYKRYEEQLKRSPCEAEELEMDSAEVACSEDGGEEEIGTGQGLKSGPGSASGSGFGLGLGLGLGLGVQIRLESIYALPVLSPRLDRLFLRRDKRVAELEAGNVGSGVGEDTAAQEEGEEEHEESIFVTDLDTGRKVDISRICQTGGEIGLGGLGGGGVLA